ncbi:sorting nexin-2 [Tyrophagus putrescentiae]|nr:sorting nexin-2 [Tyrophagus putrescentiae]
MKKIEKVYERQTAADFALLCELLKDYIALIGLVREAFTWRAKAFQVLSAYKTQESLVECWWHSFLIKQRLTLASLGSPKTPAYSDLARFAREALVGGRFCCAPPVAQAKRGGNCSGSSKNGKNGSETAQPEPPAVQLLR